MALLRSTATFDKVGRNSEFQFSSLIRTHLDTLKTQSQGKSFVEGNCIQYIYISRQQFDIDIANF